MRLIGTLWYIYHSYLMNMKVVCVAVIIACMNALSCRGGQAHRKSSPLCGVLAIEGHRGQVVGSVSVPASHYERHVFTQSGDACQLTDEVEVGRNYRVDGALVSDGKVANLRHVLYGQNMYMILRMYQHTIITDREDYTYLARNL